MAGSSQCDVVCLSQSLLLEASRGQDASSPSSALPVVLGNGTFWWHLLVPDIYLLSVIELNLSCGWEVQIISARKFILGTHRESPHTPSPHSPQ